MAQKPLTSQLASVAIEATGLPLPALVLAEPLAASGKVSPSSAEAEFPAAALSTEPVSMIQSDADRAPGRSADCNPYFLHKLHTGAPNLPGSALRSPTPQSSVVPWGKQIVIAFTNLYSRPQ